MTKATVRKTRLCFVIDKLALRSGGAERVLIETANALYDRGYGVEIVTHEVRGKAPFYPVRAGIILSNIRPRNEHRSLVVRALGRLRNKLHRNRKYVPGLSHLQWLSEHYSFCHRLGRHIDATQPDVVIGFLPPAVTALGLAKTTYKPRLFASLHNVPEQDFNNPERWDPNPVDRKLRKRVLHKFDGIGTLLPEFVDWFDPILHDRILVMPNAANQVDDQMVDAAVRDKTVVSVGRLADVKQHILLIRAWELVADDFPDWRCDIYGVGPLKSMLESEIEALKLKKVVHLRGNTRDMEHVYLSSSILAHPAKFEGFGLVVTEALAHGVPVIGFEDCSGFNYIVEHEKNGIFVSSKGDRVKNLAAALAKLMAVENEQKRMGLAGRERVKDFSPDKVTDLWEQAIHGHYGSHSSDQSKH
jgi:glycosyltransferase involved in cell wall biosynthesis